MSESAGEITYTVDMETAALMKSTEKTDENLDKLQKGFDKTDAAAKKFGNTSGKAANEIRPLTTAIRGANDEANKGVGIFGKFGTMLGAFAGIGAAQQILRMTESYGEMSERIRMATNSQQEFELVQGRLLASANETYRSLKETQEIYIRTSSSLKAMGYETSQMLEVTESFSLAMVKSATSQERAQIAMGAFSRALAKGRVDSDAWEMMLIAIPSLAEDMGMSLNKTAQQVRQLGVEGKITTSQLTEGLRKALDGNREAAAGMAVTVKDAYQQLTNNLSVFLGEANKANEVTATMSLALQGVAGNIEEISKVLMAAGVGALAAYIAKQAILITTSARMAIQSRAVAVAELEAARSHMTAATAATAQATAYARLGVGSAAVVTATNAQAAAATRLAAAQAGVAGASRLLVGALGGPVGIIALAASAAAGIYLFRDSADAASPSVEALAKSVKDLTTEQADLQRIQLDKKIAELELLAQNAFRAVNQMEDINRIKGTNDFAESIAKQKVVLQETTLQLQEYAKRRKELDDYVRRPIDPPKETAPPTPTTSTEGQKRLAEMRQEVELMKLSGEARAKLQAIQSLGETATKEERAEAEKLAVALTDLEKKHKDLEEQKRKQKQVDNDAKKGAEDNAKAIKDLTNEITMASLKGAELAQVAAVLKLNEYATPAQIEEVKKLAAELYKINEATAAKKEFGVDVKGKIRGEVEPLTGGPFDDQTARYDAEAQAEQKRYADQLERLKSAKQLELEVVGGYQALEQEMAKDHADRLMQIEMAKKQVMVAAIESSFGAATDAIGDAFGKQSGIYKAAFVAQKIAAIAQAALAIQTGVAMAAANPFPYNLAAMASVAASTAGIISNIQSISMGGGRQYGGPVQPNAMHRVNENGKPEIFNAANGRQYMIPNQRGEVVSNRNASRGSEQKGGGMQVSIGNITLPGVTNAQEGLKAAGAIGRMISAQIAGAQRYN
jgi:tape measure domain-containing protein